MRCADGFYYVVKFQNNPQHTRVLVNDWLGTRLAELIGLPVPVAAIVDVHPWLLEHTPELRIELCGMRTMFTPGLSFGSRYVVSPLEGQVYDYLPETMISRVRNLRDFAGILALDKWTCNANGRQAAFWKLAARTQADGLLHRSGILLQRRRMEFSRLALARRLRPQRRLRMCHIVGQLRALAQPHRKLPGKFAVAAGRRNPARMVWRGQ